MASGPRSCRLFRETGCWGGWKRESGNEFAKAFVLLRAHVVWRKRPRRRLKAVFYCWSANTYRLNHLVCRRRFQNFDGGSGFACGKECGWNSLQFEFCPACQNSGAWPSHETNREKLMIGPKTFSYKKVSLDLPACYHEKKFLQFSSLACRLQKIAEVLNYSLHRT